MKIIIKGMIIRIPNSKIVEIYNAFIYALLLMSLAFILMMMLLLILQLWEYLILTNSLNIVKVPKINLHMSSSGVYYSEMASKYSTKVGFKRLTMELIPISKSQFRILMPQQVVSSFM